MKTTILMAVAIFAFVFANAQEGRFKFGTYVGLPVKDIKDKYAANFGADVAYTWNAAKKFDAGFALGFSTYLGKNNAPTDSFIPFAIASQYSIADNLYFGADLGYSIYLGNGSGGGGFLLQPKFGFQNDLMELYVGYRRISVKGFTFSSVNIGVNYKL